jgi:hypothetical protein
MRHLLDSTELRIPAMDSAGLDMQVLSLNAPGIQAKKDTSVAITRAKLMNDRLAEAISKHPTRFTGYAALPTQDPEAAAKELERAVTELGRKGGVVTIRLSYQSRFMFMRLGVVSLATIAARVRHPGSPHRFRVLFPTHACLRLLPAKATEVSKKLLSR